MWITLLDFSAKFRFTDCIQENKTTYVLNAEVPMFWLTVKSISAGLFASECTVEFATTEGDLQIFVSKHQVDEGKKALKVMVLEQDERYALVQVPSQGGGSVAKVSKAGVLSPA